MTKQPNKQKKYAIRFATRSDVARILTFIRALAAYEDMLHEVVATEASLEKTIFDDKHAEVIFCDVAGKSVGFALFFHNYSTFLGQSGLYLEDLFIDPAYRGQGLGKALFSYLAKLAVKRNCGRLEWWCLDWNKPSIDFYNSLGSEAMDKWTVYRLTGDKLKSLADS